LEAVRKKVEALFPANEVEPFTELFWQRIQDWRQSGKPGPPAATPKSEKAARAVEKAKPAAEVKGAVENPAAEHKKPAAKPKAASKSKAKSKKVVA
jgi:hypothetical protein